MYFIGEYYCCIRLLIVVAVLKLGYTHYYFILPAFNFQSIIHK